MMGVVQRPPRRERGSILAPAAGPALGIEPRTVCSPALHAEGSQIGPQSRAATASGLALSSFRRPRQELPKVRPFRFGQGAQESVYLVQHAVRVRIADVLCQARHLGERRGVPPRREDQWWRRLPTRTATAHVRGASPRARSTEPASDRPGPRPSRNPAAKPGLESRQPRYQYVVPPRIVPFRTAACTWARSTRSRGAAPPHSNRTSPFVWNSTTVWVWAMPPCS